MDKVLFEPRIRCQMKEAIASVYLKEGHGSDVASDASEMFVRLIEMSMSRLENAEGDENETARHQS